MSFEEKKDELANLLFKEYITKIEKNNIEIQETIKIQKDKSIDYLNNLINLYKKARGIKNKEENYDDFIKWLYDYMCLTEDYAKFEQEYGYKTNSEFVAELNKGKLDSIVKYPAKIISPYSITMGEPSSSIYNFRNMTVIGYNNQLYFPNDLGINTFLTQNPYNKLLIQNYERIGNNEDYNLGIGVYGFKDDEDMKEKLLMLNELDNILNNSSINYETDGDKYFGIVTTGIKKKVLSKRLSL